MDWKFGSSATDWIFSSSNYEVSEGSFTIVSAPAVVQRGGSFTLDCTNVSQAPTSALLDGEPLTVDDYTEDSIDITIPLDNLTAHGNRTLSVSVDGVVGTVSVIYNPQDGWSYTTITSVDPGDVDMFEDMVDLDTDEPLSPTIGGQIIYTNLTTPNNSAYSYPAIFYPDTSLEFDVGGDVLDGTESIQYRYLLPNVAISNTVTATASDFVNTPPNVVTPIADRTVTAGESFSFSIAANFGDVNGDLLTYAKLSGPVTVSVSNEGLVTGSIDVAGSYTVVVQASDGEDTAQDSFDITVNTDIVINPIVRLEDALSYADENGIPTILALTAVQYAVYSGGPFSGTRLLAGTANTDANGFYPDIDNDLVGNVGDAVTLVLRVGDRSILIDTTVIDGNV